MATRAGTVARNILVDAALPMATETYTVISHGSIINNTMKALHAAGFQVVDEVYKCNSEAQVAQGLFKIQHGDDPDMGMMFAFANSYDKSMRFKCAIGGFIHANEMSVISGNIMSYGRKHTGTADDEVADTIQEQIDNAEAYFTQLVADKEAMKNITLTERQFAELLGVLYMEYGILTGEQMGIIKREFKKPSFNYTTAPDSLWTLYNHILVALDKSHPRTWMDQQKVVHFHLLTEYNLSEFDEEQTTDNVETPETEKVTDHAEPQSNPNQLDLAKQAEAVEETGAENISHVEPAQMEVVTEKSKAVVLPGYIAAVTPEDIQEEAVTPEPTVDLSDMVGEYSTEEVDFVVEEMKDRINEAEGKVDEEQVLGADDLMLIPQQDVFGLYPDVEIGAIIELEGYPIEVIDVEGDSFVLKSVPVVKESPEEKFAEAMVSPLKSTDPLPLSHLPDSITETKMMPVDEVLETYPDQAPAVAEAVLEKTETPIEKEEIHKKNPENIAPEGKSMAKAILDGDVDGMKPIKREADLDAEEDEDWEKMGMVPIGPTKVIEKNDEGEPLMSATPVIVDWSSEHVGPPEMYSGDEVSTEIQEKLDDPIRTAISQEIFDLYGTMQEYDYKLEDGQYNVTLKTGEVVVLLQSEIDRQVGI